MTKFLSKALQAPEPFFRLGLQRLEAASGHPSADIRFSTEVTRQTKQKLRQLRLDPEDTTPEELYHALQEKVKDDDARLTRVLRRRAATYVSAEANLTDGMVHALRKLPDSKRCFALKPSALKTIMKKVPPKKAMKQLGYRSLESFLKHEAPISILSAAWLVEDHHWHKRFRAEYKRLRPADFETRSIAITQLNTERWRKLAERTVNEQKHNLLSFREFGVVAFLPLPEHAPAGSATVSLSLALHEMNEIRAASTFLKLNLVRPDFGDVVRKVADEDPELSSELLDHGTPWKLVHRYYARFSQWSEAVFEPHLQLEDMVWHPIEETLSSIEPSFGFWRDSAHLGLLHEQGPVSCNIVDAALNYCNRVPFEKRLTHYFQHALWHELLMRYLRPEAVERSIAGELQPQLAEELATA
ncbi:MAG TPA: hypothetical protein VHC21_04115 [Candidatus Saccharimonadales bacterium]|nr:hypothetical protein [Candidatus Saccharimonadales bacterium]